MKIFFPTDMRSAFNPGLALRICVTVTLMFFSRYASTMASSVSPDWMTYSNPLSDDAGPGLAESVLRRLGGRALLCRARRRSQHFAQLQQLRVRLLGVLHPLAVHLLHRFGQAIQIFRAGRCWYWAWRIARAGLQSPSPARRSASSPPPAPRSDRQSGRPVCSAALPSPRPARAKPAGAHSASATNRKEIRFMRRQ